MKNIKHGYYKIFQEDNKGVYYEYYFWNNYPHVYEGDIKEFKEITSKQAKELLGDLYGIKQEEEVPTGKVSTWYSLSRIKIPEIKRDLTEFLENKIKEQNESVRWYHKGKLDPAEPSKEKEKKRHEYELITYRGGTTYMVENRISDNDMILFNNFHYHLPRGPHDNIISDVFYPIEDEMKKRIFDDRIRISIYNNDLKKWEEMI